jgi:hypothetical protein
MNYEEKIFELIDICNQIKLDPKNFEKKRNRIRFLIWDDEIQKSIEDNDLKGLKILSKIV